MRLRGCYMPVTNEEFEAAVAECTASLQLWKDVQWKVGDWAVRIAGSAASTSTGGIRPGAVVEDGTRLEEFADRIGLEYERAILWRGVATAWPAEARRPDLAWGLYQRFYTRSNRFQLLDAFLGYCRERNVSATVARVGAFEEWWAVAGPAGVSREERRKRGMMGVARPRLVIGREPAVLVETMFREWDSALFREAWMLMGVKLSMGAMSSSVKGDNAPAGLASEA